MAQFIKNRLWKTLLLILSGIVLLLAVALAILQIPLVQTYLVNKFGSGYLKESGFSISIQSVSIKWFDEILIREIDIHDPDSNRMISANTVIIDFDLLNFIREDQIEQDRIYLDSASIVLTAINDSDSTQILNLSKFLQAIRRENQSTKPIIIHELEIRRSSLTFFNPQYDRLDEGFDVNYFDLVELNSTWNEVSLISGTIDATVSSLSGREKNIDLQIASLSTLFHLDNSRLDLHGLDLQLGQSRIMDTLELVFEDPARLAFFKDSVDLHLNFEKSEFFARDLKKLVPAVDYIPDRFTLSGEFTGTLSEFRLDDFAIDFGRTRLRGSAGFAGLPNVAETFMNIRLIDSRVVAEDIRRMIRLDNELLSTFGEMGMNGRFIGYPSDFVASGQFNTSYGKVITDINLKLPEVGEPSYEGKLDLEDFDAGRFSGTPDLGRISFQGEIQGSSFSRDKVAMEMIGDLRLVEYKGYPYRNIYADGNIADDFFSGYLRINDPNLKFELDGTLNFNEGDEQISIVSILDHVDLKALGFSDRSIIGRASSKLDFSGLKIDDLVGTLYFNDVEVRVEEQFMKLDTITLISGFNEDSLRQIYLDSELGSIDLAGKFKLQNSITELQSLFTNYYGHLTNTQPDTIYLAAIPDNEFIDFEINIIDINPLLNLIDEEVRLSPETNFSGNFSTGEYSEFKMTTHIDSLRFRDYYFTDNLLELELSQFNDSSRLYSGSMQLNSTSQDLNGIQTENAHADLILEHDELNYDLFIEQTQFNNLIDLSGRVNYQFDSTVISVRSAYLDLLSRSWKIDTEGKLVFRDSSIQISNVIISNEYQGFSVDGGISRDPGDTLQIKFESLGLENINSLINKQISGSLNGYMNISNFYDNTRIESDLSILDFAVNDFGVGNVFGAILWDKDFRRFDLDFSVIDDEVTRMEILGYYDPQLEESLLLDAELKNTPINLLEPWIDTYFSRLDGTATGSFQIKGTPLDPKIFGKGIISGGRVLVNYLGTEYQMGGDFSFSEDIIFLDDISVRDPFGGTGILAGSIDHGGFKSMFIDITGNFRRFQLLNTSSRDNSLFYGQGFGTGSITMKGPVENLSFVADATTDRGTRIYIPIGGLDYVDTQEFINFTSLTGESTQEDKPIETIDLSGITLDLNIAVTNEAYCEIIFDIKAGDIIRGRGNGDINLRIDTNGEFNMFGPLNIEEGWYNFTLYNLINKEFNIQPGGRITWYGDPYEGIMDLSASYSQPASLAPILPPAYRQANEVNRTYPTSVLMDLNGPLLSPEITFDISMDQLPRNLNVNSEELGSVQLDLAREFQSYKSSIDEQELKRQVFSLIVLKKFSLEDDFRTGEVIGNSVSELFSNQLSYWMSQVDENLEIDFDVDLASLSQNAFNTFQLRLSYAFFDGRLRVTSDRRVVSQDYEVDPAELVGNWSVEYLITPDGRLKARVYNQINYDNPLPGSTYSTTTGISMQLTQNFNEFIAELQQVFTSSKKKEERKQKEIPPSDQEGMIREEDH